MWLFSLRPAHPHPAASRHRTVTSDCPIIATTYYPWGATASPTAAGVGGTGIALSALRWHQEMYVAVRGVRDILVLDIVNGPRARVDLPIFQLRAAGLRAAAAHGPAPRIPESRAEIKPYMCAGPAEKRHSLRARTRRPGRATHHSPRVPCEASGRVTHFKKPSVNKSIYTNDQKNKDAQTARSVCFSKTKRVVEGEEQGLALRVGCAARVQPFAWLGLGQHPLVAPPQCVVHVVAS